MIDGLQYFFDFILFSLGEPAVAIIVALVFYFGRVFGRWTRSFNVWKYLALGYFGILIFRPLEELGIIFGGVFILGAASMYLDLFREYSRGPEASQTYFQPCVRAALTKISGDLSARSRR